MTVMGGDWVCVFTAAEAKAETSGPEVRIAGAGWELSPSDWKAEAFPATHGEGKPWEFWGNTSWAWQCTGDERRVQKNRTQPPGWKTSSNWFKQEEGD